MIAAKFNYSGIVQTVKRLITRFGAKVDIVAIPKVANVESWKAPTAGKPIVSTVSAVFLEYEQKYIDGTNVHQGDQKVMFANSDLKAVPNLNDHILRKGVKWSIKNISPLNPGDQIVYYVVQVRQ